MTDAAIITLDGQMKDALTVAVVRQIGDALERSYPGWMWYIEVREKVAIIKTMHADPRYGFVMRIGADPARQAIMAGGEMLERLGLPRKAADWNQIDEQQKGAHGFMEYQT